MKLSILLFALSLVLALADCSKQKTSQTEILPDSPVIKSTRPDSVAMAQSGPIEAPVAGSVWDVATRDGRLPKDLITVMKDFGINPRHAEQVWQRRIIDIDGDGALELLLSNVMEWCGSGGCGVWLWQRTPNGLRNLVPTDNIVAVAVAIESTKHAGYSDLRFYHRKFDNNENPSLASDLYVWSGSAYVFKSSQQHGKYLNGNLPPNVWKTTP